MARRMVACGKMSSDSEALSNAKKPASSGSSYVRLHVGSHWHQTLWKGTSLSQQSIDD